MTRFCAAIYPIDPYVPVFDRLLGYIEENTAEYLVEELPTLSRIVPPLGECVDALVAMGDD